MAAFPGTRDLARSLVCMEANVSACFPQCRPALKLVFTAQLRLLTLCDVLLLHKLGNPLNQLMSLLVLVRLGVYWRTDSLRTKMLMCAALILYNPLYNLLLGIH
eukprot:Rmarinus@m.22327